MFAWHDDEDDNDDAGYVNVFTPLIGCTRFLDLRYLTPRSPPQRYNHLQNGLRGSLESSRKTGAPQRLTMPP